MSQLTPTLAAGRLSVVGRRGVQLLAATVLVAACGSNSPLFKRSPEPRSDATPNPAELPTLGGSRVAIVAFGTEGPKIPSLVQGQNGTWSLGYGSEKLGNKHIFYTTSQEGTAWAPSNPVQAGELADQDPALYSDGASMHFVFSSNRDVTTWALYRCDQLASGWALPVRLNLPGAMPTEPTVARTPTGWALAYRSTAGLVVTESPDGQSWPDPTVVATHQGDPAMVHVDGRILIVAHRANELFEIWRDASGHWTAPRPLGFTGLEKHPALAVDPKTGNPVLVFAHKVADGLETTVGAPLRGAPGQRSGFDLAASTRIGGKWTAPFRLTYGGAYDNYNPTLQITSDGKRHVAWGIFPAVGERGILYASYAGTPGSPIQPSAHARSPGTRDARK